MSYVALYRKFRPLIFEDVKGQDHIVTTLKNQIQQNRLGHAYLFTGTRGTGKTTVAKIFAKAVNCENPAEDGSPCGHCKVCEAINAGNSLNVIEIDAASNNGVDNIREIIEEVAYPPTEGKYKVYIIDEVHMLSTGAFNALLKTLEEPPEYVIFILATTEVHKIPITILSRCQRYDFRHISLDTIADRLRELMDKEGIEAEDKAVRYIAKAADGSMRDALSLLEQCIAFYMGETLTYDKVLNVLGVVDTEVFSKLLRAIIDKNVTATMTLLEEVVMEGRDLRQFVTDFTWYLRNLLLIKNTESMEYILDISSENLELLKEEATMVDDEILMRYIRILSDLSNDLRYASQKRIITEIALIKLCKPEMEEDHSSIIDRLNALEHRMEEGGGASVSPEQLQAMISAQAASMNTGGFVPNAGAMAPKKQSLPEAVPEIVQKAAGNWKSIVAQYDYPIMKQFLLNAYVTVDEQNRLVLVYDKSDNQQNQAIIKLSADGVLQDVENFVSETLGSHVSLTLKVNDTMHSRDKLYEDAITAFGNLKNITIETEDF